jgi:6-phosphogluconolactonase
MLPLPHPRLGAIALGFFLGVSGFRALAAPTVIAYVGTGTDSSANAIYAFRYDEATGSLDPLGLAATTPHPTFLAMHPNGRFLYAVNEENPNHTNGHSVAAFAVDGAGPKLVPLGVAPCGGDRPCAIAVDATGRFAFVANYGSGTMAALPVRADGGLDSPLFVFQDPQPTSPHPRQTEPHAHCVVLDPTNQFLYSCDLGADKVMIYRFDAQAGVLSRNRPAAVAVPQASGPRHIALSRDGRRAYVLNEIASTLIVFDRRPEDGSLAQRQALSTLPAGWSGQSTAAEIALDASGRFLYTSNRGHDSIAVFALASDGSVRPIDFTPCGKQPRFFTIDPGGNFLLTADQAGDAIAVFRIDPVSGRLSAAGRPVPVANPVCIVFGKPLP